jgi:hypothetical protein
VGDPADPRRFYTERIPEQFNRALERQEAAGESGRAVLEGMRGVDATIRIDVEGQGGGRFFLNIAAGRMIAGSEPLQPPFLTVLQDRRAFERIAAEAGDSALALLGGLSGLAAEMRLTRSRLDNLRAVSGSMQFEVRGDGGFSLRTHFGPEPVPAEPDASIAVDEDAYRALRAGELDPQSAFLAGRIAIEGDLQLAMQLALAAIAPD